ncbi:MAG: ribonuclease P protein component [Rhodobacteraceae bacterium]|nr:ribonuclease P protein component [Paracoccaceae bacterium]
MTPPGAQVAGKTPNATTPPPAVSSCLTVLSKRADFLRAARARRQGTPAFTVQARERSAEECQGTAGQGIRIGYTCSKKVGNAVARNRAKRRLREIARAVLPVDGRPGWDYVLIGRPDVTASRALTEMQADLRRALAKLHGDAR